MCSVLSLLPLSYAFYLSGMLHCVNGSSVCMGGHYIRKIIAKVLMNDFLGYRIPFFLTIDLINKNKKNNNKEIICMYVRVSLFVGESELT